MRSLKSILDRRKRKSQTRKKEGKHEVRCGRCGQKFYVPLYIKAVICKDCYQEDGYDYGSLASSGWNYKTINDREKTKDSYIVID